MKREMGYVRMINILVTLNANYIPPLKVMLKSLFENNAEVNFSIYIMHSQIPDHKMNEIHEFVTAHQHQLHPISVPTDFFNDAPTFRHYTTEMYYRLACHHFLPEEVDRILYLDPDIVVINPITAFYETDFGDHLFVAAEHEHTARLAQGINKLRLKASLSKGYVNTGVLLMNVARMRKQVHLDEIYAFIEKIKCGSCCLTKMS